MRVCTCFINLTYYALCAFLSFACHAAWHSVAAVTSEPDGRSRSLPRAAFRMPCVPAAMPISAQSAAAAFVLPSSPCFCVSGASAASVAHHASSALDVHQSCLRWGLERLVAEAVALYRGVQDMLNGFDIFSGLAWPIFGGNPLKGAASRGWPHRRQRTRLVNVCHKEGMVRDCACSRSATMRRTRS